MPDKPTGTFPEPEYFSNPKYILSKNAVLETFDDGGLVLILPERRVLELNPSEVEVIHLLDGKRSPEQVAAEMAKNHDISDLLENHIIQDMLELYSKLDRTGVLERIPDLQESVDMASVVPLLYQCNPDVVTREEDPEEGALLFNPDTNQVKVINTTGLFIWQQFGAARTTEQIIAEVQKGFDEVPPDQVAQDVKEFVDGMLASGFIGTVETLGK